MKENKNIPFRNYIFLSIILILSIVVIIYFYMWYGEFETNRTNIPIMDKYLSVINYNELDTYLVENKDVVIYVSILDNDEIRRFENQFKEIVNEYSLNNSILYLDLTNEYDDKNMFDSIEKKYNLLNMPCIVLFKDGIVNDVYSIGDRDYDIELLVSYLRIKGVIYD